MFEIIMIKICSINMSFWSWELLLTNVSRPKHSHSVNCHVRNKVPWKIQVKKKLCNKLASFFDFLPQKCTLLYGIHFSFSLQENTEKLKKWCRVGYFHIFRANFKKIKKYQTTRRVSASIYLKVIYLVLQSKSWNLH